LQLKRPQAGQQGSMMEGSVERPKVL